MHSLFVGRGPGVVPYLVEQSEDQQGNEHRVEEGCVEGPGVPEHVGQVSHEDFSELHPLAN